MQFNAVVALFILAVALCLLDVEAKSCKFGCAEVEKPVCGLFAGKGKNQNRRCTFGNNCKLNSRRCEYNESKFFDSGYFITYGLKL